ncbi:MAG: hypothetical protein ACREO3_07725 [Arenimonas sp.]
MSAVIRDPRAFEAARVLRDYAASHGLPARTLLLGCGVVADELEAGRTVAVAVCAGQRAMRDSGPLPTTHGDLIA